MLYKFFIIQYHICTINLINTKMTESNYKTNVTECLTEEHPNVALFKDKAKSWGMDSESVVDFLASLNISLFSKDDMDNLNSYEDRYDYIDCILRLHEVPAFIWDHINKDSMFLDLNDIDSPGSEMFIELNTGVVVSWNPAYSNM